MRALRFHAFGGPEVLRVDEVPEPDLPASGEVRVRVHAAGVNFADTERRRGLYLAEQPLPDVLGFEGAGVVDALGANVDASWLGRRVAFNAPRAQAELCVVPVSRLLPLPERVDFVCGAAFPVQWLTAWHVLHTVARVQRGERVVIHSGAGGVGQALVQLAVEAGAEVIATVSRDAKAEFVKRLGAHEVLTRPTLPTKSVDVVLEGVGADTVDFNVRALRPFGRWVHFGTASGPLPPGFAEKLFEKSLTFSSYWLRSEHPTDAWSTGVREVMTRIESGRAQLEVHVATLEDAARWHRRLEAGLTTGKVVLTLAAR